MCGFPVDLDVEVLSTKHCTIQEGQAVVFHVLPGELDVLVRHVAVSGERFHFLGFDLDPCVVHIPKPVSGRCSVKEFRALSSTSSMERLATMGDTGEPKAQPCFCL